MRKAKTVSATQVATKSARPPSGGNLRQTREKASRFAVLGMLALGSKSGYDIKKAIAESTSNFWSESYGNIYPVLRKLLAEGAIRSVGDAAQARSRHKQLYGITANGRRMMEDWLRQPAAPRPKDDELLLQLFFGWLISPGDSLALLKTSREHHVRLLTKYDGIRKFISMHSASKEQKTYWLATLHYGEAISHALLKWCDVTERELRTLES